MNTDDVKQQLGALYMRICQSQYLYIRLDATTERLSYAQEAHIDDTIMAANEHLSETACHKNQPLATGGDSHM